MSSIRQIFPLVLSIQITVAVGITGWVSFNSSERAVSKLTRQLCDNLNYRVEHQIRSYLKEYIQINQSMTIALSDGSINLNDINQVQKELFNKSKELNKQNVLYYGNESGTMAGLERYSDGGFQLRIREDANSPNRPSYELSNNGERGKLLMTEVYDHRRRPWYIAAKASGKAIWGPIYVSVPEIELSSARATPIYKANGELQGVSGINVPLKQIKQFMLQIRPSEQWNIFLAEGNGDLVATTSEIPIFEKDGNVFKRFGLAESKDPRLQAASLAIQKQFNGLQNLQDSQIVEFEFNSAKYIVITRKLDKELQLDWSVGLIVPKSIFMQEIDTNNQVTLIIIVILLGINIVIGLVIAAWLLRPIKNLMTAAKEIEEESFEPEKLAAVAQRKDELGQMARVFQEMGSTISERQNGMKSQLTKLRAEKDEAKKAVIASQMGQTNSLQSILNRSRDARNK